MLGLDTFLGRFPFQTPASVAARAADVRGSEPTIDMVGSEWVEIDEPGGYFVPRMTRKRRLLQLDQVHHVLQYANFARVMRIHDLSLATSVEEVGTDGCRHWWMTLMDPSQVQVWVVRFPSRCRLQAWVDLLRAVVNATGSHAIINDIVELDARHEQASSPRSINAFVIDDLHASPSPLVQA